MEKGTPHCKLPIIKALIKAGKIRMTASAVVGAEALGFDRVGMIDVILALSPTDFFKSMTTYGDHRPWSSFRPRPP